MNCIKICLPKISEWVEENKIDLELTKDNPLLINLYLTTLIIIHECEHAKQYLMSKKIIQSNYELSKVYYDVLKNLNNSDTINTLARIVKLTRALLYKSKENLLILERNAIVESLRNLIDISKDSDLSLDTINKFKKIYTSFLYMGYSEANDGCIKYTYSQMKMKHKYNKLKLNHNMPFCDKVRYGFELTDDEYQIVLKLKKEIW